MKGSIPLTTVLLVLSCSGMVYGQAHEDHGSGMTHKKSLEETLSGSLPIEGGQSAFTAIAEIVSLLESDTSTDWSTVRIDALRTHLVDMDRLILDADVNTQVLDGARIRFSIEGHGRTLQAVHRMVPAHAKVVRFSTGWRIDIERETQGVTLIIDQLDAQAFTKLKSLGFFGFMTIGAHHQAHHYQMALGKSH